jgi:hypothetical protein
MYLRKIPLSLKISINLQTTLAAITRLAERLALTQQRASNTEWSQTIFAAARRLMKLSIEEQLMMMMMMMMIH